MSSRLDNLNLASPPDYPNNGAYLPDFGGLQFDAANSDELAKQLEAWTNVSFTGDGDQVGSSFAFDDPGDVKRKDEHAQNIPYGDIPTSAPVRESRSRNNAFSNFSDPPLDIFSFENSSFAPDGSQLLYPDLSYPGNIDVPSQPEHQHSAGQALGQSLRTSVDGINPVDNNNNVNPQADKRRRVTTKGGKASVASNSESPTSPAMLSSADSQPNNEANKEKIMVEEDRRRRNTQASARFRVKKKQREAALNQRAKELETQVGDLEKTVESLKTENKWLRGLITDTPDLANGGRSR